MKAGMSVVSARSFDWSSWSSAMMRSAEPIKRAVVSWPAPKRNDASRTTTSGSGVDASG